MENAMIHAVSSKVLEIGTWGLSTVKSNIKLVALTTFGVITQSYYDMTPVQTLAVYTPALAGSAIVYTPTLVTSARSALVASAASIHKWIHKTQDTQDTQDTQETQETKSTKNKIEQAKNLEDLLQRGFVA